MNLSDESQATAPQAENESAADVPVSATSNSMPEFYQLQQQLFLSTLAMTGIIFIFVWIFYSANTALNYLLGACTGVVYLKMLARSVERLGPQNRRLGKSQIAVFIGLIIVAAKWNQLHVLPIFLGFLTYKAAILAYMLRLTFLPNSK